MATRESPTKRRNATYFAGDLRRSLLDQAVAEIERHGPGAVSLRALAAAVGVSHAAPKHHFPSKRALFAAIAVEGFEAVDDRYRRIIAPTGPRDTARDRLQRGALDYVRFAGERPGHYAVMWQPDLHGHAAEVEAARAKPFGAWVELLREAQIEGFAADLDIRTLVDLSWSMITGLATLAQITGGPMGTPMNDDAVKRVLQTVIERVGQPVHTAPE